MTQSEVDTATEIIRQKIKDAKLTDNFWCNMHISSLLNDIPINQILNEKDELDYLTPESIQKLGLEIFEGTPAITLSLFPAHS